MTREPSLITLGVMTMRVSSFGVSSFEMSKPDWTARENPDKEETRQSSTACLSLISGRILTKQAAADAALQSMFEMLLARDTTVKGGYIGSRTNCTIANSHLPRPFCDRPPFTALETSTHALSTEGPLNFSIACLSILGTPLLQRKLVTCRRHRLAHSPRR